MTKQTATVKCEEGLHARPATEFCKAASKFQSRIFIQKEENEFDAKSILMVLSIGACKGDELEIVADGPDEEEALGTLVKIVEQE